MDVDDASSHSSMPELEAPSPSSEGSAPPTLDRIPVQIDAAVPIVIGRAGLDREAVDALLRRSGQFQVILDISLAADHGARVFLHFSIVVLAPAPVERGVTTQTVYRIDWRWLRGLVYADDSQFWIATRDDLDLSLIPEAEHRFARSLAGSFVRTGGALPANDATMADAPATQTAAGPTRAGSAPPGLHGEAQRVGTEELPAYPYPDAPPARPMEPVQAPRIAPPLPVYPHWGFSVTFNVGMAALRRFFWGSSGECISVITNWLATDRLVANAERPGFSPRTPAWTKSHCSSWEATEVLTCNAGNICGIDYKLRLADGETVWIRDTCIDWIRGASEAVQKFWDDGHCPRSDVAEKMLHQRPTAYATAEWDAALLEWARRGVDTSHVYKVVDGRIRSIV